MEGVSGPEMRRVSLPQGQRSGVLTHGSILTLTSNPDRTSLVRRGAWVLDNDEEPTGLEPLVRSPTGAGVPVAQPSSAQSPLRSSFRRMLTRGL